MYDKSKGNFFFSFNPALGDLYLLMSLMGESDESVSKVFISHGENEKILLERYVSSNNATSALLVYYHRLVMAFWFRDFPTVLKCCEQYDKYNEAQNLLQLTDICKVFFGGLASFIVSRKNRQDSLIADGEKYLSSMQVWEACSKWNFENKVLLLQAECHFANGDNEKAKVAYQQSITSSHDHKFIHEEALANELFGIFCVETGDMERGIELLDKARELYKQWGAHKKVSLLFPL